MIDVDKLAEWRRLAEAATKGPWATGRISMPGEALLAFGRRSLQMPEADAVFIAAAREAVPALLDEVERLRKALEAIEARAEVAESRHLTCEQDAKAYGEMKWYSGHSAGVADTEAALAQALEREVRLREALEAITSRGELSTHPTTGMVDMVGIASAALAEPPV
mgnify:CR=1 FL=1